MGIFAIRSEGNKVTNRLMGSNEVRNVRNERPPLLFCRQKAEKLTDSDAAIYKRSLEERNATQVFNNKVNWAIKPNPE